MVAAATVTENPPGEEESWREEPWVPIGLTCRVVLPPIVTRTGFELVSLGH